MKRITFAVACTACLALAGTAFAAPQFGVSEDMTKYADQSRPRAGAAQPADLLAAGRLSITRRPLADLGLSPTLPLAAAAPPAAAPGGAPPANGVHPDIDFGSTFDVPAFLRRQES